MINEMKKTFFNFFDKAKKIQKFIRELKFIRENQIELLTKLWVDKVGELYKSGLKKSKKHQITAKRIINISDEERDKIIKVYYNNKINEFNTNFKLWLKFLKSDKTEVVKIEKHKKKEEKKKGEKKKKIVVSEKPLFIFIPTLKKFNVMILKASEKK